MYTAALDRDIGNYFHTYGSLSQDIITKLGFTMAAKYLPAIFQFFAYNGGYYVATYDHAAYGHDVTKSWFIPKKK